MKKIPKETLKEKMLKAGYPYCYRIKGVDGHCQSCIKYYKLRIKREKEAA